MICYTERATVTCGAVATIISFIAMHLEFEECFSLWSATSRSNKANNLLEAHAIYFSKNVTLVI